MTLKREFYILLLTALALWACSTDDSPGTQPEPERRLQLNMTICLQPDIDVTETAAGDDSRNNATTRALGDPGTYEHFAFPGYFYVYAVGFTDAGGAYPEATGGTVCPLVINEGGSNVEVNRVSVSTDPSNWNRYYMYVDPPQTLGDSVYGSVQNVSFKVPAGLTKMRFYIAASPVPLKHDGHELGVKVGSDDQVLKATNNESDVLGLMFDVEDNLKDHLRDVYSSPYNYAPTGQPYYGLYYYTVPSPDERGVVSGEIGSGDITRIIYHVASKVDVMWNIDKDRQADNRITYIEARKLKQKNCYLFRQMENTWDATDDVNNYSLSLMAGDIGRQWYGRQYFYTIPYKKDGKFDVNLHILKAPDSKESNPAPTGYNLQYRRDLSASAYSIFTPWVRADLRFTHDITYKDITVTSE